MGAESSSRRGAPPPTLHTHTHTQCVQRFCQKLHMHKLTYKQNNSDPGCRETSENGGPGVHVAANSSRSSPTHTFSQISSERTRRPFIHGAAQLLTFLPAALTSTPILASKVHSGCVWASLSGVCVCAAYLCRVRPQRPDSACATPHVHRAR